MDELNMSGDILAFDLPLYQSSYIKVIGVGGGGSNAVNHMYKQGINGVDFIVCNTDAQALDASPVPTKVQLGKGLGAGNMPAVAQQAAEEKHDEIKGLIDKNTQMLFITAGMGGGTGTGAAPVIASIAKEIDLEDEVKKILTVAIVTTPFTFEGRKRQQQAVEGITELRKYVDAILIINNDKLREFGDLSLRKAFAKADDVLTTAAKGISEIITVSSYVQIDFKDVNTVMSNSGVALMGCGYAEGENRAAEAVSQAVNSPLLNDNNINGAKNILLYISSGSNTEVTMEEIDEITNHILRETGEGADLIWGAGIDDTLEGGIAVTLIATGFNEQQIFHIAEQKTHRLDEMPGRTKVTVTPSSNMAPSNEGLENIMTKAEKERMETDALRRIEEEAQAEAIKKVAEEEARLLAEAEQVAAAEKLEAELQAKQAEVAIRLQEAESLKTNTQSGGISNMVEDWANELMPQMAVNSSMSEEEKMQKEWEESEAANAPLMEDEDSMEGGDLYQMLGGLEIIEKRVVDTVATMPNRQTQTENFSATQFSQQKTENYLVEDANFSIDLDVMESAQASVAPKINSQPDVHIPTEVEAASDFSREFQAASITPTIRHRAERLRELSDMIKTQKGLEEIENVPAYLRRNIKLDATVSSSVSEAPKHVLSMDGIVSSNSFLHDNVD